MQSKNDNESLIRALANSPPGTFKLYCGSGTGADDNILDHLKNINTIGDRIKHAINAGCLLEVISLRLQIIDYWLRVYFVNKAKLAKKRGKEFGLLLGQCKNLGFDQGLYEKLLIFNKHRINAIHGFVVGKILYEKLNAVVTESKPLTVDVIIYVLENCGEPISSLSASYRRGDMILNVPAQIMHLKVSRVLEAT